MGIKHLNNSDFNHAIKYFKISNLLNNDIQNYIYLGLCYKKTGLFKKSKYYYDEAVKFIKNPKFDNDNFIFYTYYLRASLIYKNFKPDDNEYDTAINDCAYLFSEFPDSLSSLELYTKVLIKSKDYQKAFIPINKYLNLKPTSTMALLNRATLSYCINDFQAAQKDLVAREKIDSQAYIINNYLYISMAILSKDYKLANFYLEELYDSPEYEKYPNEIISYEILLLESILYYELGNTEKAQLKLYKSMDLGDYNELDEYPGIILYNDQLRVLAGKMIENISHNNLEKGKEF